MRIGVIVLSAVAAIGLSAPAAADEDAAGVTAAHLTAGSLAAGATELDRIIAVEPDNAEAKFGLGMIRFVQAVEHLSQGLYRYGLQPPRSFLLPIVRLPVPVNPDPEPVDYDKFRGLLLTFVADLAVAEEALAAVPAGSAAKVPVNLAEVRYDADGDGTVGPDERLVDALAVIMDIDTADLDAGAAVVAFDTADAFWLRGYANVLMALGEFLLAHDWRESFDVSFHVFFPRAHSAFQEALASPDDSFLGSEVAVADLISFLHIRWPVAEPARMASARLHLKAMVALSRENWAAAEAETDNDREWLPSADQVSYLGTEVTATQIAAWHDVLDEVDALLDGDKLMPHWRFDRGVNIRRVFEEPRPFDLVLWITGPSALPYLEDGPVLTGEEWSEIISAFEGSFGSYAVWFN